MLAFPLPIAVKEIEKLMGPDVAEVYISDTVITPPPPEAPNIVLEEPEEQLLYWRIEES